MIQQPQGSKICGQIAVAVVAGISLERAIEMVGHSKGTKTAALVKVLRELGFTCPDKCMQVSYFRGTPPQLGLAIMRHPWKSRKSGWHWVAIVEGEIVNGIESMEDWEVTSYLPVSKEA